MYIIRLLPILLLNTLAFCGPCDAQDRPPKMSPREAILHQQMHGYLDALVDMQVKAQQREAEWAEYSKPLWADRAGEPKMSGDPPR
jgi:hypothetical protein